MVFKVSIKREAVRGSWEKKMARAMFHVVNKYIRAAQFEGLTVEVIYRLQKVGEMILGFETCFWYPLEDIIWSFLEDTSFLCQRIMLDIGSTRVYYHKNY